MVIKKKHDDKWDVTIERTKYNKGENNEFKQQNVIIFIITIKAEESTMAFRQRLINNKESDVTPIKLIPLNIIRFIHKKDVIRIE